MTYYEKLEIAADLFTGLIKDPEVIIFGENMIPMFEVPAEVMEKANPEKFKLVELFFKIMPKNLYRSIASTWRMTMARHYEVNGCTFYLATSWAANVLRVLASRICKDTYVYDIDKNMRLAYDELCNDIGLSRSAINGCAMLLAGNMHFWNKVRLPNFHRVAEYSPVELTWLLTNRYIDIGEVSKYNLTCISNVTFAELEFAESELASMLGLSSLDPIDKIETLTIGDVLSLEGTWSRRVRDVLQDTILARV